MTDFAYTLSAQAHYDAAHFLRNYEGKCSRLHGHRYVVEAALQATVLDDSGIAFDFIDLKKLVIFSLWSLFIIQISPKAWTLRAP